MEKKRYEVSCEATLICSVNADNIKKAKQEAEKEMVGFLNFIAKGEGDIFVSSHVKNLKVIKLKD